VNSALPVPGRLLTDWRVILETADPGAIPVWSVAAWTLAVLVTGPVEDGSGARLALVTTVSTLTAIRWGLALFSQSTGWYVHTGMLPAHPRNRVGNRLLTAHLWLGIALLPTVIPEMLLGLGAGFRPGIWGLADAAIGPTLGFMLGVVLSRWSYVAYVTGLITVALWLVLPGLGRLGGSSSNAPLLIHAFMAPRALFSTIFGGVIVTFSGPLLPAGPATLIGWILTATGWWIGLVSVALLRSRHLVRIP
jgi:hypothetical protein